jgi:plasmid maintenance system antidote protein VapI
MALRLGRCLGRGPEFWLNLQTRFDMEVARDKTQRRVEQEVHAIAK